MSISQDELNKLIKKAETKGNGVWSREHRLYAVKNNNLHYISNQMHNAIYLVCGNFITQVWQGDPHLIRKTMKEYIENDA